MRISEESIDKITTIFNGEPAIVCKAYRIVPAENPPENDLFNTRIGNILKDEKAVISENGYVELKNGKKYKCIYHNEWGRQFTLEVPGYTIGPNERLFVFTNIKCARNRKVIIRFGRNCRMKVWMNDKFVCNESIGGDPICFLSVELNEGDNIFFVECTKRKWPWLFDMRIYDYDDEMYGINGKLMKGVIQNRVINKVSIVANDGQVEKDAIHKFMIVPKDFINVSDESLVKVVVENGERVKYDEFDARMCEPISYDVSKIRDRLSDNLLLSFNITLITKSGKKEKTRHDVLLGNFRDELDKLRNQYKLIQREYSPNEEDKINIEGRIDNIEELISISIELGEVVDRNLERKSLALEIAELHKILESIKSGLHFNDFASRNSKNKIYFRSHLDDQLEMYSTYVPSNYCSQKRYPLLIFVAVYNHQASWENLEPLIDEDVIMLEITIRGITGGSYVGEAAFLEVMEIVSKKYNIDTDRVYLIGYSNGAMAAWAISQAYPYLFAAMAPTSGLVYAQNLRNLSNIKILNITGEFDHMLEEAFNVPMKLLTQYGNYEGILAKAAYHHWVSLYMYSKYVLGWVLKHRRTRYPEKIYFRTERIRHNKTHWIEIVSIESGKKSCEVEGELVGDSVIKIDLVNIAQFVLEIPDFMKRDKLLININRDNTFVLDNLAKDKLYFKKKEGVYHLVGSLLELDFPKNSKGMGILDIYMDRLKVVIPSEYTNEDEERIIKKIAQNFSKPQCRGWDPTLHVNYSIVNDDKLTKEDLQGCNLIVVDVNGNNKLIEKIKNELPFKFDERGYLYQDNYKKGDYTLVFIVPNPMNESKKILVVCSNKYRLLKKNIFTRKVIIPTYSNGLHPFLNSEAIVYDGKKYLIVDVIGNDMTKVV